MLFVIGAGPGRMLRLRIGLRRQRVLLSATKQAVDAAQAFKQFMGKVFAPGALDVIQKELMTIALSVAVQCEPCLKIHLEKAREVGISAEEIEEAAWMGVAFGGCKAMMFWQEKGTAPSSLRSACARRASLKRSLGG